MFPGGIGGTELLIIMIVAVLLFGRNLPEVARNLGQSYQQFRKGLSDIQSTFRYDESSPPSSNSKRLTHNKDSYPAIATPTAPRFEPPEDEADEFHQSDSGTTILPESGEAAMTLVGDEQTHATLDATESERR